MPKAWRRRGMLDLIDRADPVSEDRLLDGRVRLRQAAAGYRAAIDPVLLAAAVPAAPGTSVVDLGCGAGAALLCLAARVPDSGLIGVDADAAVIGLAQANIESNGLRRRAAVVMGDICRLPLAASTADHVMVNPPYLAAAASRPSPIAARAAANREGGAMLGDWLAAAQRLLKPRGWLTLIHRADRLDAVMAGLAPAFGAVSVLPVWPKAGKPASRIIVRARRDARTPASLLPGLVLHGPSGAYTARAEAVLRHAAPLSFAVGNSENKGFEDA